MPEYDISNDYDEIEEDDEVDERYLGPGVLLRTDHRCYGHEMCIFNVDNRYCDIADGEVIPETADCEGRGLTVYTTDFDTVVRIHMHGKK